MASQLLARRPPGAASSSRSDFAGVVDGLRRLSISQGAAGRAVMPVEMRRECQLTKKFSNNGNRVTFSGKRNKHVQRVNLQWHSVYWEKGQRMVKLRICAKALRTIRKKGLDAMAKEADIDLWKLPFKDCRPERRQYLAEHPMVVPAKKNPGPKKMKNPEKLAASKKTPLVGKYLDGRVVYVRAEPGQF
ncbi:unnamed protein product [Ostreobium quekettii]|uniref:Large ribosomal subunit protein bL28c n=1 Tax=Ostreobium quekettii TaxID=121088 RepID=A0A8S1IL22_9CHLO|nr:unnamed protein product [Ostreobium quekettii]|eukprot:evm.model.scf_773.1 EVM.evm.TU.scf_773.1   scf_773:4661-6697(-)